MPLLVFICVWVAIAIYYAFRFYIGVPASHTLLPFQQGLLYRNGHPIREVGPGRHRVFMRTERITFLDTRPIQFKAEQKTVALSDRALALFGFAISAEVRDVKKASYASVAYSKLPAFVALSVTRRILSESQSSQVTTARAVLTEEIKNACRTRLADIGFELLSFQFTQLDLLSPNE